LEIGQSNSKVLHQIIEIRYEIPNQVRKQVRKLQTILTVNFQLDDLVFIVPKFPTNLATGVAKVSWNQL
jgi:hypothetical protein